MVSHQRCFECLDEFHVGDERFAALRVVRDVPMRLLPKGYLTAGEHLQLEHEAHAASIGQVFLCADCAAWDREAIPADVVSFSVFDVRGVQ